MEEKYGQIWMKTRLIISVLTGLVLGGATINSLATTKETQLLLDLLGSDKAYLAPVVKTLVSLGVGLLGVCIMSKLLARGKE